MKGRFAHTTHAGVNLSQAPRLRSPAIRTGRLRVRPFATWTRRRGP